MAIYHFSAQIIGRKNGGNAKAAAAYRAGEKIAEFDYTRKSGVDYKEIIIPEHAPEWCHNREKLWSAVEESEKRKDAQVCREINLALPLELKSEERIALLKDFAENLVSMGMVADVTIHGQTSTNPHGHIMLTTRELTREGFGQKVRDWNRRELLDEWRSQWAELANKALGMSGHEARIDHRTLEAQGVDREPTRHKGKAVTWGERKGPTLIGELHHQLAEQVKNEREIAICRAKLSTLEEEQSRVQQVEKQAQEALRAQEWIERREELRQKEKEAEKAAGEFFERAAQYEGRNGLFEAQKVYEKIPLWQRAFLDKEATIQANANEFQIFADGCRKEGEESNCLSREYAEQGFQIALAHPEARDHGDQIAIERIENQRREEHKRELEKQEEARRRAEITAIESSGYRGELNRLAQLAKPNVIQKALDDWKKPYLDLIKKSNEDKNVIEWCLKMAKYDASLEGQAELKAIKSVLEDRLKPTGWSLSKKWSLVNPAMDTIRVQKDRTLATQEALKSIQHQVSQERNRGRGI